MANYPSNLPDTVMSPSDTAPPALPAQSTYDTIQNRGQNIDSQVDRMSSGRAPIQYKAQNPDNKLPDDPGIFHRLRAMFN